MHAFSNRIPAKATYRVVYHVFSENLHLVLLPDLLVFVGTETAKEPRGVLKFLLVALVLRLLLTSPILLLLTDRQGSLNLAAS